MSKPVNDSTVRLIQDFEGFSATPYRDPVGVWTQGYGETQGIGPNSPRMSRRDAERLLRRRLRNDYAPPVDKVAPWLNENQRGALISFVYNLGPGYIYRGHTMGDALAKRDWKAAADAFLIYDHAGGSRLAGLTRRRRAERELFLSPAPNRDELKVAKWTKELDDIRSYIRKHGGHWANHPIRWARAKRLKAAIKRHSK